MTNAARSERRKSRRRRDPRTKTAADRGGDATPSDDRGRIRTREATTTMTTTTPDRRAPYVVPIIVGGRMA